MSVVDIFTRHHCWSEYQEIWRLYRILWLIVQLSLHERRRCLKKSHIYLKWLYGTFFEKKYSCLVFMTHFTVRQYNLLLGEQGVSCSDESTLTIIIRTSAAIFFQIWDPCIVVYVSQLQSWNVKIEQILLGISR